MTLEECAWKKCKTMIEVDHSFDIPALGAVHVGWCDFHQKVYSTRCKLFQKLVKKYKVQRHHEVSNYLWTHDKKKHREITKEAIRLVKRAAAA